MMILFILIGALTAYTIIQEVFRYGYNKENKNDL